MNPQRVVHAAISAVLIGSAAMWGAAVFADAAPSAVKVGVTRGTHAEIMNEVRRVATARGLDIEVVTFDSGAQIDAALAAHRIDAASFEDGPGFEASSKNTATRFMQ